MGQPKGCIPWNKNKTGCYSEERRKQISDDNRKRIGEKSPRWDGGKDCYLGYVAKRVLEEHGGIKWENMCLPERATIHHINKNRNDNRFENLCVMTASDHTRFHNLERMAENPELRFFGINQNRGVNNG